MYEKYELPIRFTEEQRKKYAEWGIKKGKVLNATFDEIKKIGWDRFVVNR